MRNWDKEKNRVNGLLRDAPAKDAPVRTPDYSKGTWDHAPAKVTGPAVHETVPEIRSFAPDPDEITAFQDSILANGDPKSPMYQHIKQIREFDKYKMGGPDPKEQKAFEDSILANGDPNSPLYQHIKQIREFDKYKMGGPDPKRKPKLQDVFTSPQPGLSVLSGRGNPEPDFSDIPVITEERPKPDFSDIPVITEERPKPDFSSIPGLIIKSEERPKPDFSKIPGAIVERPLIKKASKGKKKSNPDKAVATALVAKKGKDR